MKLNAIEELYHPGESASLLVRGTATAVPDSNSVKIMKVPRCYCNIVGFSNRYGNPRDGLSVPPVVIVDKAYIYPLLWFLIII